MSWFWQPVQSYQHLPAWHTYLSYHLYDVTNFQLQLIIILGQVAERHLAPAPPTLA